MNMKTQNFASKLKTKSNNSKNENCEFGIGRDLVTRHHM